MEYKLSVKENNIDIKFGKHNFLMKIGTINMMALL